MKDLVEELYRLHKENPALPVICNCDVEVCDVDGYAWGLGEITSASVEEIFDAEECRYIKSDADPGDMEDEISCFYNVDAEELSDEQLEDLFNKLPWYRAVVISIGPT